MASWRSIGRRLRGRGATPTGPLADEIGRELVQRWRRGDATAFTDLFRTYRQLVYGVLYHLMPGDPEIEDVVQTTFVEVFRSLDRFEGRSRLSSWIARVALHMGFHHLRRKRSRILDSASEALEGEASEAPGHQDPEAALEQREAARRVYRVLEQLAPKKRAVFILADLQGLSHEEIAEIVGSNLSTVRTRLFYARRDFWRIAREDPILAPLAPEVPRSSGEHGDTSKGEV